LKPGDKIIKVNNKDASGMELDDVVKLIKNKKKVNIIVKRDNKEKEITLKQNTNSIPLASLLLTLIILSPGFKPALSAGESLKIATIIQKTLLKLLMDNMRVLE